MYVHRYTVRTSIPSVCNSYDNSVSFSLAQLSSVFHLFITCIQPLKCLQTAMDRQQPELKTEDVCQLPLLSLYPVLKRILQYVYGSSRGATALRCRLVCRAFNDLMTRNVQLHVNYEIRSGPNRCRVCLKGLTPSGIRERFPTDRLIDSSLIKRIFTMKVVRYNTDFVDEGDLLNLASGFSRPVDVSLYSSHILPLLPLAEMPQMRVVEVERMPNSLDLTPPELNFLAQLPHLSQLSMSRPNVQQLSQHVDLLNITKLQINRETSRFPNLDVSLIDNFSHLQSLNISGFKCHTDMFSFTGVSLPHLVKCELFLTIPHSFTFESEVVGIKRLLTSMHSAMPKLSELRYSTDRCHFSDADQVGQLISVIFQFCPATVEDFDLDMYTTQRGFELSRFEWKWLFRILFSSILDSNVKLMSLRSWFSPVMDARPFQFRKSRGGVQVGQPVKTMKFTAPVHKYLLKRRNGQFCTVDVICWD